MSMMSLINDVDGGIDIDDVADVDDDDQMRQSSACNRIQRGLFQ